MTGPLPWYDPGCDVGADMVETAARWIAAPGRPDEPDVRTAAAFIGRAFPISDESIGEALRRLTRSWPPRLAAFNERATSTGKIDLSMRRPMYGGRTTHHDLDVDHDRIAAAFDAGQRRPWPLTLRTREDVQRFGELDDRMRREQHRTWTSSRACGKTAAQDRLVREFASDWFSKHRTWPEVHRSGAGHHAIFDESHGWIDAGEPNPWLDVDDLVAEWNTDAEREAERMRLLAPYLRVVDQAIDDLAEQTGVPPELLDYRRLPTRYYGRGA